MPGAGVDRAIEQALSVDHHTGQPAQAARIRLRRNRGSACRVARSPLSRAARIYVAGHQGMVGSESCWYAPVYWGRNPKCTTLRVSLAGAAHGYWNPTPKNLYAAENEIVATRRPQSRALCIAARFRHPDPPGLRFQEFGLAAQPALQVLRRQRRVLIEHDGCELARPG